MPLVPLDRLPLPSLRTYATLSVALVACSFFYVYQLLTTSGNIDQGGNDQVALIDLIDYSDNSSLNGSVRNKAYMMAYAFYKEPWCLVTLINMAYCCLVLFGKLIQKIVFGQLRVMEQQVLNMEQQHIKDKFWNFVFYKFIFIFGVMNVQEMEEIVLWCTWFSVLGFLHILAQLCKDRFEYFSSSPATSAAAHAKVLLLLTGIHVSSLFMLLLGIAVSYYYTGVNTFAFMAAECLLLIIKTMYVLVRYGIHLWDLYHDGVWENRAIYVYYSDLLFEVSALSVDFCHHLHMLLWGNIFLSMASLVICMQLRYLFHELQRRIRRHKNYRYVVNSMEAKFPMALPTEIQGNNDNCAICWEKMEMARKLPCGHMFHNACLRSWLEQDTSCPTCRISLSELQNRVPPNNAPQVQGDNTAALDVLERTRAQNRMTNHFHFDGSRYVSWLPSFSVEVHHMNLLGTRQRLQTSLFDNMAHQVREVFPDMPLNIILDDLRVTRSVEITIENIVEGRLLVPHGFNSGHDEPDLQNFVESDTYAESSDDDQETTSVQTSSGSTNSIPSHTLTTAEVEDVPEFGSSVDHKMPSGGDNGGNICEPGGDRHVGSGFRFSKSPVEREEMLESRKKQLLNQARRRFLAKDPPETSSRIVLSPLLTAHPVTYSARHDGAAEEPLHDGMRRQQNPPNYF